MPKKHLHKLSTLPVFYDLAGKDVLIAGDDAAVLPKARLLAMTGARVKICAPGMKAELEDLQISFKPAKKIEFADREWRLDDLQNAALAIGAFIESESANRFRQAARDAGVPINLVDRPALCDFQIPVIVNRSPLVIGISTGGAAPVIGQWLRGRLESLLPSRTGVVLKAASALRGPINAKLKIPAARRAFWKKLAEEDLTRLARGKTLSEIKAALLARLENAEHKEFDKGRVLLVTVPDLPEDMPLKILALLQNADVIVRSGDVDPDYLDFARRDARQIEPGDQNADCQEIISLAQNGQYVIWLHGKTTRHDTANRVRLLAAAGIVNRVD